MAPLTVRWGADSVSAAVVLGSVEVDPLTAQWGADSIDPQVVTTIVISPLSVEWEAMSVDPAAILGSIVQAPLTAQWGADSVNPTAVLGSVTIVSLDSQWHADSTDPSVSTSVGVIAPLGVQWEAMSTDPTVSYGSVTAAPLTVQWHSDSIDPIVTGAFPLIRPAICWILPPRSGCIKSTSGQGGAVNVPSAIADPVYMVPGFELTRAGMDFSNVLNVGDSVLQVIDVTQVFGTAALSLGSVSATIVDGQVATFFIDTAGGIAEDDVVIKVDVITSYGESRSGLGWLYLRSGLRQLPSNLVSSTVQVVAEEIETVAYGSIVDFVFLLRDADTGAIIDISDATLLEVTFRRPTGTEFTVTATLFTDGTDGKMRYITLAGDLNAVGIWQKQPYFEKPTFPQNGFGGKTKFRVLANL